MDYTSLNRYTAPGRGYTPAWTRVLSRLGDDTALIVSRLNIRPIEARLHSQTNRHVLVRISTHTQHLILRIAPEVDLVNEVTFGKVMLRYNLPTPHIIHADLERKLVPFDYTLEQYIGGTPASTLATPQHQHLLYDLARQTGRILRRLHRVSMPGWGRPSGTGRWLTKDWATVLQSLHERMAPLSVAVLLFSDEQQAAIARMLTSLPLTNPAYVQPRLLHGALRPETICCTVSEDTVRLETFSDPGTIIAGDSMIDLALALDPTYPQAWRTGLYEGYTGAMPLTEQEQLRLHDLHVLVAYWSACQNYAYARPHQAAYAAVLAALGDGQADTEAESTE
ncbi:MAG: aminoglycoside phosphotransferase family protein [Chloroflexaceae bacterium]|nr:aminoglycoside phosphotransferase family protein [Chloroflexaceae bacterium]